MIEIAPAETALLVIDVQNGMCHPEGTLGASGVDTSELQAIIPKIGRLVETCRTAGIRDIWSIQEHFAEDATRENHRITPHTLKRKRIACLAGTWDAEIMDELKPLITPETQVIRKHKWSMFYGTRLEPLLRILGVRLLLVCGTTSNACVDATVRDAYMRDYDVLIVSDCIAGVNAKWHETALEVWSQYVGELVTLEEFEHAVKVTRAAT